MIDAVSCCVIAAIFFATAIRPALGFGEALLAVPLPAICALLAAQAFSS